MAEEQDLKKQLAEANKKATELEKENKKLSDDNNKLTNDAIVLKDKMEELKKKKGNAAPPAPKLGMPLYKGGPVRVSDIAKRKELEAKITSKKKGK